MELRDLARRLRCPAARLLARRAPWAPAAPLPDERYLREWGLPGRAGRRPRHRPARAENAPGFQAYVGSQDDADLINRTLEQRSPSGSTAMNGSHVNAFTIRTFEHFFPRLSSGAIHAIEDMGARRAGARG